MNNQRESVVLTGVRALITTAFGVVGLCLGLFLFLLLVGGFSSFSDNILKTTHDPVVLHNADRTKKAFASTDPTILQLEITGVVGLPKLRADKIRLQLLEAQEGQMKDTPVKGILLHIDSPGGTVTDADAIYHAVKEYKERYKVPVYAYVDGLCASGGMYIACSADKIYASNVSLVGSVGVILNNILNFSELMNNVGVKSLTLYAGKGKDDLNPLRPWKEGEAKPYQEIVDYYYNTFVNIVVENRHRMTKDKLINDYGAAVYPAAEALTRGYVDVIQNDYFVALADLVKEAGLEGKTYQVVRLEDGSWFKELFGEQTTLLKGSIQHEIKMPSGYEAELMNKVLYLYRAE